MGGLKGFKKAINMKEFYREFRENVRDPLAATLTGKSDKPAGLLLELLEDKLPEFLYEVVIKLEGSGKPGIGKFVSAIMHLSIFLKKHDLEWATPWLVPIIQRSVRMIYRNHFEEFFDEHNMEDTLEWLIGFELSSPETVMLGQLEEVDIDDVEIEE